jgi:hypothetical protein
MKKYLFVAIAIMILFTMGFLVSKMKPEERNLLLTVDTEYSFVMGENSKGTVMYYVTDIEHPLTKISQIMRVILYDQSNDQRLDVNVVDIEIGHEEVYLKERYYRIMITFDIPKLSHDMIFDDAYMTIELMDQLSFSMRLGRLSLYDHSTDEPYLNWTSLSGLKNEGDLRSRIGEIIVSYEGDCPTIDHIDIGTTADLNFTCNNKKLIISIGSAFYLLYDVPIIITYHDGTRQVIDNFRYIIDYVILKESGPMINVYTLD